MALGVTMHLPTEDKHTVTRDYLETQLAVFMGGRCAEEIFLKQMTTGAGNDIQRSTALGARNGVRVRHVDARTHDLLAKKEQEVFLGREIGQGPRLLRRHRQADRRRGSQVCRCRLQVSL